MKRDFLPLTLKQRLIRKIAVCGHGQYLRLGTVRE